MRVLDVHVVGLDLPDAVHKILNELSECDDPKQLLDIQITIHRDVGGISWNVGAEEAHYTQRPITSTVSNAQK